MIMLNTAVFAVVAAFALSAPAFAQDQDGPIVTGNRTAETADALKVREAIAYANPLPRGAPTQDYPLVAWCDALVTGHADLGDSLTNRSPEDTELVRLGRRHLRTLAGPHPQLRSLRRQTRNGGLSSGSDRRSAINFR